MTKISVDKYPAKKSKNGYMWRVRFKYKDAYGKVHPYSKGSFVTKKQAQMHGVEKLRELEGTTILSQKETTINQLWNTYVELDGKKLAARSLQTYQSAFRNHVSPVFGDVPIQQISYIQLKKFFTEREHLAHKMLKKIKSVISHCYITAMNAGLVQYDLTTSIKVGGKPTEKQDSYISFEEFHQLEDRVRCSKRLSEFQIGNRLMVLRIGYYLGLRAGEIHGLKFGDIDWENHTISIQRQLIATSGGCVLTEKLKTPTSRAELPICKTLYDYLVDWRKTNPFDMVISNDSGQPLPRRTTENYFRNICPGFHLHQLRHSFATNLHLSGVDQVTASSLTRHGSVEVLNNIYIHPQESKKREAVEQAFPETLNSKTCHNCVIN